MGVTGSNCVLIDLTQEENNTPVDSTEPDNLRLAGLVSDLVDEDGIDFVHEVSPAKKSIFRRIASRVGPFRFRPRVNYYTSGNRMFSLTDAAGLAKLISESVEDFGEREVALWQRPVLIQNRPVLLNGMMLVSGLIDETVLESAGYQEATLRQKIFYFLKSLMVIQYFTHYYALHPIAVQLAEQHLGMSVSCCI